MLWCTKLKATFLLVVHENVAFLYKEYTDKVCSSGFAAAFLCLKAGKSGISISHSNIIVVNCSFAKQNSFVGCRVKPSKGGGNLLNSNSNSASGSVNNLNSNLSPKAFPPAQSPGFTPVKACGLDPERLQSLGCLYHTMIYVWLKDGGGAWIFPTRITDHHIHCYGWHNSHWVTMNIPKQHITAYF